MQLNRVDLDLCRRPLTEHKDTLAGKPSDMRTALWTALLTKFFSCFSSAESRGKLHPRNVFQNDPVLQEQFKRLESIRNKHVVHDANNMTQANVVVQITDGVVDRSLKVIIVGEMILDKELCALSALIERSISYACCQINKLIVSITQDLDSCALDDLLKLNEWRLDLNAAIIHVDRKRKRLD